MTEQFAFKECRGEGAAVHGHKLPGRSPAMGMGGPGEKFFSCSALSAKNYGTVCGGDLPDFVKHFEDVRVFPNDTAETISMNQLLSERNIFFNQTFFFDSTFHCNDEFFVCKRFGKVVEGTEFHGLHGILYRRVSRHHDDIKTRLFISNRL